MSKAFQVRYVGRADGEYHFDIINHGTILQVSGQYCPQRRNMPDDSGMTFRMHGLNPPKYVFEEMASHIKKQWNSGNCPGFRQPRII